MSDAAATPVDTHETVSFGAGCFWGVEASFRELEGVVDAAVGYQGGTIPAPTYEQVCTGATGHAEVVEVTYDPARISFIQLLEAFFGLHDPTQKDRQGPDVGTQYRSVVFVRSPEERQAAQDYISRLDASGRFRRSIATTVEDHSTFYRAEEYHQQYLAKRGQSSCRIS